MANEDIVMQSILLAREHIEQLEILGQPYMINTSPVGTSEYDVLALKVIEYMLIVNEHDRMAVMSNLDDLQCWTLFMGVSDGVESQPFMSTNANNDWHTSPQGFVDLLASLGFEGTMLDAHYRAGEAIWWFVYIMKVVTGTVAEIMANPDMLDEEE